MHCGGICHFNLVSTHLHTPNWHSGSVALTRHFPFPTWNVYVSWNFCLIKCSWKSKSINGKRLCYNLYYVHVKWLLFFFSDHKRWAELNNKLYARLLISYWLWRHEPYNNREKYVPRTVYFCAQKLLFIALNVSILEDYILERSATKKFCVLARR